MQNIWIVEILITTTFFFKQHLKNTMYPELKHKT
jgi:hypothetical protein